MPSSAQRVRDDAVVVRRVARVQHRGLGSVGELDRAVEDDDELLALVARGRRGRVRGELDAEGVHVAVGLADRERVVGVAGRVFALVALVGHLDGGKLVGARDDGVGLELVVHERAEALSEGAGEFREHAQRGQHLAVLDGGDHRRPHAALLGQVGERHLQVLAVRLDPLPHFVLVSHFLLPISCKTRIFYTNPPTQASRNGILRPYCNMAPDFDEPLECFKEYM